MKYWLMKTEPNTFSVDDFAQCPDNTTQWEGIRNYQARNFIRDEIKKGDKVFIYHSIVAPVGIVGIAEVVRESYPDYFQFDPDSKYYDPKSSKDNPRWVMCDVKLTKKLNNVISLQELKNITELQDMKVVQKGQRLSVQPVTKQEWDYINNNLI